MDALQQFGISLIQGVQTLSPALDGVMNFFTFLGRVEFYLLIIPFLYWAVDKHLGIRTIIILLTVDIIGTAFKLLFHQPRPYWIGDVQQLSEERSYGIPSTHASDSIAVGGYLAYRVRKTWFWVVTGIIILFIGLSRLYLGVHFLHDVVFGWLIGVLVLWLAVKQSKQMAAWARSKTLFAQIGFGFAASIGVILLGVLIRSIIAVTPDPTSWSRYATEARSITHSFTLGGTLFGSIAGYAMMRKYARFQPAQNWGKRIFGYILGIIVVLALYFGLDIAFSALASDETLLGYLLRYIRYTLVNIWLMFGAPWLFLKAGLAQLESKGI